MHRLGHIRAYWSRLPKRGRKASIVLGAIGVALLVEVSVVLASAAPSPSHHAAKASGASASAQALTSQLTASGAAGRVIVGHATASRSKPLREMRALPMKPGRELETLPNNPMVRVKPSFTPDAARQTRRFPNSMPNPILNFDGIGFPGVACNCAPPDTDGEVGLTQYVQMVNEGFEVWDKSTGASSRRLARSSRSGRARASRPARTAASAIRSSSSTSSPTAG